MTDTNDELSGFAATEDVCCHGASSLTVYADAMTAQAARYVVATANGSSLSDDGVAGCRLRQDDTNHVAAANVKLDNDESSSHVVAGGSSLANGQANAATPAPGEAVKSSDHCDRSPQGSDDMQSNNNNAGPTLTVNGSISIEDEDDFVAIELVSPTNDENSTIMQQEQAALLAHDQLQSPPSLSMASNITDTNNNDDNNNSHNNHNQQHRNQPKRKTLHHPLLSPLTKLPWDKFISAAGACDILFNCKYSTRQVEDEVREEKKNIPSHDAHHVLQEQENIQCAEHHLDQLGLHWDSDEEDHNEGAGKRDKNQKGVQQDVQWDHEHRKEQDPSRSVMEEEKAKKSWRNSNPSLDMMLYRQFLDE